jgi:hypothetical protein
MLQKFLDSRLHGNDDFCNWLYSYKSQPNAINQTAGNVAVLTGKLVDAAV